jgi:hypothetical protein
MCARVGHGAFCVYSRVFIVVRMALIDDSRQKEPGEFRRRLPMSRSVSFRTKAIS